MKRRLVVIGAGLGGLSLALRASSQGWNVTVVERHHSPGGKMNRYCDSGYVFDTGPSLITLPQIFFELFDSCQVKRDHLHFRRLQPLTLYVYPDGTRIPYPGTLPDVATVLERFEPDGGRGFWHLMSTGARLFELSWRTFFRTVPTELPSRTELRDLLGSLRWFPFRNAWGNYARTVERYVHSEYLRRIFLRYPTYVGSSPYRSPATLLVIPYLEFAHGGWYPDGGLYRIVETIVAALRERNVSLLTGVSVEQILHHNGQVTGVRLANGEMIPADVVAYNGDASTADALLGRPLRWRRLPERSMSGVVFLVGLKRRLPEDIHHHTIVFSSDYQREFRELVEDAVFPTEPTVYLNVTSKTDTTVAPPGGETLFIMANAPARTDIPWAEMTQQLWERVAGVLRRAGVELDERDIATLSAWTPQRFEQEYGMPGGSIYGFASHSYRTTFLRPAMRDRFVKGVYYVGGSTHPGGGTPMVVLSSKLVFNLIQRYEVAS
ncbi:MAG: phytoene desaturase family protein [Bacteroidota bacterium]|nr:phytoene desaturase family protein [Bacteroidota bacterium]